ncbi:centrosomal protein of 89 kDa-like [Lytechinus variegatus]|uniref:centrosomal protein of 89 kDa-like n=1 Tax=Lytechinus variegatus TaxID=7654 RepID=UPI001BB1DA48|nr:centrosomal protein of 89 kDa-like [Lytechinus variegatus]
MAGKKDKKQKKKNKPLSHIGTALFPRAIFAAVPRSPEPPQPARSPTPNQSRPASALSSAIMDATFVGRAIASPSPNSTLRATGDFTPREGGALDASEQQQRNLESSSMARSSMYDYDDSEEEEDDEEEDLDYMGISQREREMEYHDDPGYARVEDVQEMLSHEKRGTISNRARMETPPISGEEESPRLTDRTGTDTNRSYPVPSPRDPSTLPSTSYAADIHSQGYDESQSQGHSEGRDQRHSPGGHLQDDEYGGGNSGKRKKKKAKEKEKKQKKGKDKPNKPEGLYAQPIKKHEPLERHASILSNESDFTGVSAEDFSDLISPTPSWKRKPQSPDLGNAEVISSRSTKTSKGPKSKNTVNEPVSVDIICVLCTK